MPTHYLNVTFAPCVLILDQLNLHNPSHKEQKAAGLRVSPCPGPDGPALRHLTRPAKEAGMYGPLQWRAH